MQQIAWWQQAIAVSNHHRTTEQTSLNLHTQHFTPPKLQDDPLINALGR